MTLRILAFIASLTLALVCAIGWTHEHQAIRQARQAQVSSTLGRVAQMLSENVATTRELRTEPFAEGDSDYINAYLAKIRRDGLPEHSDMKHRIDQICDNNTAMLALLGAYSTYATTSFKISAERYRAYAINMRDRWQSVFEIFMAGGNLAPAALRYPADFQEAMKVEMAASDPT